MSGKIKNTFAWQKGRVVVLCVVLAGLFSSCAQKENNTEPTSIIGKWKLVKFDYRPMTSPPSPKDSFDYSQNNVVYEFKSNNILTVSGKTDDIDYRGLEIGDHSYEMNYNLKDDMDPLGLPYPYMLKIDTDPHSYLLSAKELKITHIGEVDAYAFYLAK